MLLLILSDYSLNGFSKLLGNLCTGWDYSKKTCVHRCSHPSPSSDLAYITQVTNDWPQCSRVVHASRDRWCHWLTPWSHKWWTWCDDWGTRGEHQSFGSAGTAAAVDMSPGLYRGFLKSLKTPLTQIQSKSSSIISYSTTTPDLWIAGKSLRDSSTSCVT